MTVEELREALNGFEDHLQVVTDPSGDDGVVIAVRRRWLASAHECSLCGVVGRQHVVELRASMISWRHVEPREPSEGR